MNTAWLASPSTDQPSDDTSTAEADRTRIRANPPPSVQTDDDGVKELPIARPIIAHAGRVPTLSTQAPGVSAARDLPSGLLLTVLTIDPTFAKQLRAALDSAHEMQIIATTDEAAELAVAGRCPILITDVAMPRSAIDALTVRLRAHDPSTAIIIAGNRDQGGMFIGLQSSGAVDGFLLKPVTVAATQLVIEAATRRHRGDRTELRSSAPSSSTASGRPRHRSHARKERALRIAQDDLESSATIEAKREPAAAAVIIPAALPRAAPASKAVAGVSRPIVAIVAIIAVGIAATASWLTTQRTNGIDANAIATKHLALAERAFAAGRLLDARDGAVHHYETVLAVDAQNLAAHSGLDRVAEELSRQTQAHVSQRRLADAALSLARLRELQPDYAELPLLDAQLQLLQNAVLAAHVRTPATPAPDTAPSRSPPSSRRAASANAQPVQVQQAIAPGAAEIATLAQTARPPAHIESAKVAKTASAIAQPSTRVGPSTDIPSALSTSIESSPVQVVAEAALARAPTPAATRPIEAPSPTEAVPAVTSQSAAPVLLKYVPPEYPSAASTRRMTGWIELSLEITPSGEVIDARIEAGEKRQLFGRAALAAVRQWQYAPDASRAAGARSSVRLEFKLE